MPSPEIPKEPTVPAQLPAPVTMDIFTCERRFLYHGKELNCDSNVRQDGERLRPIISSVPDAVAELDAYQRNKQRIRIAAYAGTLGLATAIGGFFIYKQESHPLVIAGAGVATGSLIYGLTTLRHNETHLINAVNIYNNHHPGDVIELQFTAEIPP
ncbi:MAG: hypothetical protein AABZ06_07245 [Bdellovibrionota bacterium]